MIEKTFYIYFKNTRERNVYFKMSWIRIKSYIYIIQTSSQLESYDFYERGKKVTRRKEL